MTDIIDGYLEEVTRSLRARPSEREKIERELRSHLLHQLSEYREQDPEASDEEIQRQVVQEFGNPRDLALAYTDEGAEIRDPAGETLLRIGRAVGRGTRTALKWMGIGALALLLIVGSLGVWAFYEARPVILDIVSNYVENEAFNYQERCGPSPCTVAPPTQTFHVPEGVREVKLDIDLLDTRRSELSGQAVVQLSDPNGEVVFQRVFDVDGRTQASVATELAPVAGNWTIEMELSEFTGWFRVHIVTFGQADEGA